MDSSEQRIIGKLEGVSESLQQSLNQVLRGQDEARVTMAAHVAEDRTYQERFAEGLGGLRDRVVRLEMVSDAVEGNGAAILNLEQRMTARETSAANQAAVRANNMRWIAAGTAMGAAAGSAGTSVWPKVWGFFGGWFK